MNHDKQLSELVKKVARILGVFFGFFLIYIILAESLSSPNKVLEVIDSYIRLLLNSWPGAILVLGLILLITQSEALSDFIKRRLVSVGMDGIKASTTAEDFSAILNQQDTFSVESEATEIPTEEATILATEHESAPIIRALTSANADLIKRLEFEKIYNLIFGSQLSLLGYMRANISGVWYAAISAFYEDTRKNDELLKNYPLSNYLGYLENNGLVQQIEDQGNHRYIIAEKGIGFLDYLEQNNYSKTKDH